MRRLIKNFLRKVFNPLANKLGYNSNVGNNMYEHGFEDGGTYTLNTLFLLVKEAGFQPKHIVDVGANHGLWTKQALDHFPNSQYTLIEPQARLKEYVQHILDKNPNVNFYAVGAGSESGVFDFTIVERDDSCTFLYTSDEATQRNYVQLKIPVITLNNFINEQNLPIPDIIKIDAEGLDLEVLEGANQFFGKTELFLVEASILNKQYPNSFLKVLNYMNENNYCLFDITQLNKPFKPPVLWLAELVFIKKNGVIDSHTWIFR